MDWADILLKTFIGALSGLVVAFFTTKYALSKFYHEKWWDKRMEFFKELTDTLYSLKKIEKRWYDDQSKISAEKLDTKDISFNETYEKLNNDYEFHLESLRKTHELSPLFLSMKCHELIGKYLQEQEVLLDQFFEMEINILEAHKNSYEDTVRLFDEILNESIRLLKPQNNKIF